MAKITVNVPGEMPPYSTTLDTGAMDVTIKEAFIGVGFETKDGAKLSVCMRDGGYEVCYVDAAGKDHGWDEYK